MRAGVGIGVGLTLWWVPFAGWRIAHSPAALRFLFGRREVKKRGRA